MSTGNTTVMTDMFLPSCTSYSNEGDRKQMNKEINTIITNCANISEGNDAGTEIEDQSWVAVEGI